jgi:HD-like signal output (HDOD) protein/AraC-like DNA-binding protein
MTHSSTTEASLNILVLRPLFELLGNQPEILKELVKSLGLPTEKMLEDENRRITISAIRRALSTLTSRNPDPDLGLKIGTMLRPGNLGSFSFFLMSCSDYQELLRNMANYYEIIIAGVIELRTFTDSHGCSVIEIVPFEANQEMREIRHGLTVAATISLLKHAMPAGFKAFRVNLTWPKPETGMNYNTLLDVQEVLFDQPKLSVSVAPQWLKTSLPNANPALKKIFRYELDRLMGDLRRNVSVSEKIYGFLASLPTLKNITLTTIAETMHVSERTLHRQLTDNQTNFRDLLNTFRATKAIKMLASGKTIEEMVYYLGFSERAAFDKAFKNWLGITAANFQKDYRFISTSDSIDDLTCDEAFPALPAVANQLLESINGDHSIAGLAAIVERDPALTFKMLGIANSAMFGLSQIATIEQAISKVFGVDSLRNIALAMLANNTFRPIKWGKFAPDYYWHCAFSVAYLCSEFCKRSTRKELSASDSYLLGLMHNIGLLYLANRLPDSQLDILFNTETDITLTRQQIAEQQNSLLGTNSFSITGMLCQYWQMPRFIGLTIRQAGKGFNKEEFNDYGNLLASCEFAIRQRWQQQPLQLPQQEKLEKLFGLDSKAVEAVFEGYLAKENDIKILLDTLIRP